MARATAAAAVAQGLIAIAAIPGGWGGPAGGPAELLGINGFFVVLWITAMLPFRQAAAQTSSRERG
ncbi:hypothetical protein [Wenzhouxiangella sp. EGI_FJ10305]|uniref:hypothetical protein n=1 Tax=Wenzhouxiangella sp. EGI_FJ10305 TaxID=3243768 RepID=UPI0035E22B5B